MDTITPSKKPKFLGFYASWYYSQNNKRKGHFLPTAALLAEWMKTEIEVSKINEIKHISKSKASILYGEKPFVIQANDKESMERILKFVDWETPPELSVVITPIFETDESVRLF